MVSYLGSLPGFLTSQFMLQGHDSTQTSALNRNTPALPDAYICALCAVVHVADVVHAQPRWMIGAQLVGNQET
jgi:hypothetical protein